MGALLDLTGQRFGRLLVVQRGENRGRHVTWRCQCDCGTERVACSVHLRRGDTQSCGCFAREVSAITGALLLTKHGHCRGGKPSPEYHSWRAMTRRCYDQGHEHFKSYGGRGITVCDRWRFGQGGKTGVECFFEDMGARPPGLTLDRIEVNANYDPGNCRWATPKTQARNKRYGPGRKLTATRVARIRALAHDGSMTYREIAKRFDVSRGLIKLIMIERRWAAE
jgi:hypothetical protein